MLEPRLVARLARSGRLMPVAATDPHDHRNTRARKTWGLPVRNDTHSPPPGISLQESFRSSIAELPVEHSRCRVCPIGDHAYPSEDFPYRAGIDIAGCGYIQMSQL